MWHGGALSARTTASAHNASLCVLPFTSETAPFETFLKVRDIYFVLWNVLLELYLHCLANVFFLKPWHVCLPFCSKSDSIILTSN